MSTARFVPGASSRRFDPIWVLHAAVTALIALIAALVAYRLFQWGFVHAVWNAASSAQCKTIDTGACWAAIEQRGRLVFFGLYPQDQEWRAIAGTVIILAAAVASCFRSLQQAKILAPLWLLSILSFSALMSGGYFGLPVVPRSAWGGLALTFYIFSAMLIIGMPLAIVFALLRHSSPAWSSAPVSMLVDLIRSIPLTAILFFVGLVLPTLVSSELLGDKLWRVILGFSVFFACYQSEVIRGGLQALDRGQTEAAQALGLTFWDTQTRIVMPQVFRTVLPQTVNQIVTAFKDTSYVAIVGFFDMTASASAAVGSGEWAESYVEIYLFVAVIYLVFGYSLSRYGAYLERRSDVAYSR